MTKSRNIPGQSGPIIFRSKKEREADNAAALGWRLSADEVAALDAESDKLNVGINADTAS